MNDLSDKFTERGKQEREALTGLFKELLKENSLVRYTVYHTPDHTKSKYDCLVKQYSKETGKVIKKMFFETKIRGAHYDTLLIEKQKLDSMKKLIRDIEIDKIYYVNFTPKNTIIFDLLKIEEKLLFVEHEHNKQTIDKDKGKVLKEVAYVDNTDGKIFDYVYVPSAIKEKIEEEIKAGPVVPFLTEKEVDDIVKRQYENPPLPDIPDQLEIEDFLRLDENGEVQYDSEQEFRSFPHRIQIRCVMEHFLRRNLMPNENKLEMIKKYGSLEKLYLFAKERLRLRFLARYGHYVDEPNKHEI